MESTSLLYYVSQNCNLTQVGGVLGSKGYGIALKKRTQSHCFVAKASNNFLQDLDGLTKYRDVFLITGKKEGLNFCEQDGGTTEEATAGEVRRR